MKLIGSITSPYVRKVRIILNTYNYEYEFEKLQALSPRGGETLETYGSIKRIPILVRDGKTIFDSSIISEYLLAEQGVTLSVDDKLTLRLIDELSDAGVTLFQQILWKIDVDWSDERSKKVLRRYHLILVELDKTVDKLTELQKEWLFCVLDWLLLRSIFNWESEYKNLELFYMNNRNLDKFTKTSPRD
ncbi:MAG: glutathione S-transferase [Bacteriovoracaceae bacterium]